MNVYINPNPSWRSVAKTSLWRSATSCLRPQPCTLDLESHRLECFITLNLSPKLQTLHPQR